MRLSSKPVLSFVVCALLGAAGSAQTITEFPLSEGARPRRIVAGPDGNMWFIESGWPARIGRISTSGTVTEFPIDGPSMGYPWDLTTGPDGNVYFTETDDGQGAIVRVTPEGSQVRMAAPWRTIPVDIVTGPDGNLWLTFAQYATREGSGAVARATTDGIVTVFPIAGTPYNSFDGLPADIAAGPDGNVWFTVPWTGSIGRITPPGTMTHFVIPSGAPGSITAGPDGNLWFTRTDSERIGQITPTGAIREFPVPTPGREITGGPDGALWFTEEAARLGRITTSGEVTEIEIPEPAQSIAAGPDGNIWFTSASRVWRLALATPAAVDSRILPVVGSAPGVGGSFFRTAVQLHNATDAPMTGRIVFHASGVSGSASDRSLHYVLSPGQTRSIADLLPAMGSSGLGSADLEATSGPVPTASVRVFNDAGEAGTTGFAAEPMRFEDALRPGQAGVLLVPADLTSFRLNLGIRTVAEETTATLTLRDASGTVASTVSRLFPPTYHEQRSAAEFLGIPTLPAGGSISIAVDSGAAFFYGATVDNTTGDPSMQVAQAAH